MSVDQDVYQLVVETKGAAEALKLADATMKAEKALKAFLDAERDVSSASSSFASAMRSADATMSKTSDSAKRAGQALMQMGYAADDLQYGLKGVANNIQPLLQTLGAGSGLAGALSIAAIAAVQLYNHWDDLMDAFGMGRVRTQAEQMEALAKSTSRTADETERLLKYQRQQAIIETQRSGLSSGQTAQEKGVNAAVAEGGAADAVRGLVLTRGSRYKNDPQIDELERQAKEAEQKANAPNMAGATIPFLAMTGATGVASRVAKKYYQEQAKKLRAQKDDVIHRRAEEDLAKAATDPDAARSLLDLVTSNPGAFGKNSGALASGLAQALPENMAAERENARIGRKAEQAKSEREKEERDKDIEQDYEWEKLQESNRRWKQSQQEKKRRVAENVQNARRQDPNLGDMLSTLIYTAAKQGGPEAANAAQVGLIDQLTARYGKDVATKLVAESASNAKEKYVGEMIKPGKERNSEVMDGASYARAVQAGVSNKDTPEKQLRTLQAIHEQLKRIASMTDNTLK